MTLPNIPQTTEEFLRFIVEHYLTTDRASQIGELDADALLRNPLTWREPQNVAVHINHFLGKAGEAYLVRDPGLLLEILDDRICGVVIAYTGSLDGELKHFAYLVIRRSGLEWHKPLAADRRTAVEVRSAFTDRTFVQAYLAEVEQASTLIRNFHRLPGITLTHAQHETLTLLKMELWELEEFQRSDIEKASAFSSIYLRLRALLKELGMPVADLADIVKQGLSRPND